MEYIEYVAKTTRGNRLVTRPIICREGTSDLNVCKEIFEQKVYKRVGIDFDVKEGEKWCDLGANIGVFAIYCIMKGASVDCFEPEQSNIQILESNIEILTPEEQSRICVYPTVVTASDKSHLTLYDSRKKNQTMSRFNLFSNKNKGREVINTHISAIQGYDGVKMDIEGSELQILDFELIPKCDKLMLEYHFKVDRSMISFKRRVEYLRSLYSIVDYYKSLDKEYPNDIYPGIYDRFIYCKK